MFMFIALKMNPMWQKIENQLRTELTFRNFTEAFAFMTEIAMIAEKQGHHPTWTNTWNKVSISLSTHEAGNVVTNRDRELADAIEKVYQKYVVEEEVLA